MEMHLNSPSSPARACSGEPVLTSPNSEAFCIAAASPGAAMLSARGVLTAEINAAHLISMHSSRRF